MGRGGQRGKDEGEDACPKPFMDKWTVMVTWWKQETPSPHLQTRRKRKGVPSGRVVGWILENSLASS